MSQRAMQTTPSRLIPSTDIAAYLVVAGFPLKGCRSNGRGVGFLFDDCPQIEDELMRFTNGGAQVEPRAYLRTLNDLRDLARSHVGHL